MSHRIFKILRQLKPFRQIDVVHAMIDLENYSGKFALAMLETAADDQLVDGPRERAAKNGALEVIRRLERELAVLQADTHAVTRPRVAARSAWSGRLSKLKLCASSSSMKEPDDVLLSKPSLSPAR